MDIAKNMITKQKHTHTIVQFTPLHLVQNKSINILQNTKAGLAPPSAPCPELLPSFPTPKAEPAYYYTICNTLTT
jgi:hypothetical protein